MSLDKISNSKKLGIYISFKSSEKQLYDDVKLISNYSTVIKELLVQYLENGKCIQYNQSENDKSMLVTVDDLCKIISSVNSISKEISLPILEENRIDNMIQQANYIYKEQLIPEDMLLGL